MRKKIITQEQIIQTAMTIIESNGPKACSMRRMAKELNIAVGTLYNYYPSQEALLEAVLMSSWQETFDEIQRIATRKDVAINKISSIITCIKNGIHKRQGLGKVVIGTGKSLFDVAFENNQWFDKLLDPISMIMNDHRLKENIEPIHNPIVNRWVCFAIMDCIITTEDVDAVVREIGRFLL
jgi:AcrR family transcriptional regulator